VYPVVRAYNPSWHGGGGAPRRRFGSGRGRRSDTQTHSDRSEFGVPQPFRKASAPAVGAFRVSQSTGRSFRTESARDNLKQVDGRTGRGINGCSGSDLRNRVIARPTSTHRGRPADRARPRQTGVPERLAFWAGIRREYVINWCAETCVPRSKLAENWEVIIDKDQTLMRHSNAGLATKPAAARDAACHCPTARMHRQWDSSLRNPREECGHGCHEQGPTVGLAG
jgi:hypothetical protein